MTTVQIPDELANEYAARAQAAGCDTETFIRAALISRLEDLEDLAIVRDRLANPGRRFSLEEVKRDLGLDD